MKAKIDYTHKRGLPGGPNEQFTYVTGIFSVDGYRNDSPDVNNPFNVIPSGRISMREHDGTPLKKGPILGIDNLGNKKVMLPGNEYQFPGDEVIETPLEQFPDGGSIYTYPGRPGSYYKKDGNKWLISNANTGGQYVPVDDPSGQRTAALNKGATVIMANPTAPKKDYSKVTPSYNKSGMVQSVAGRTEAERQPVQDEIAGQQFAQNMERDYVEATKNQLPQHEQPLDMMDEFWQAAAGLPTGLKAVGQLAALRIPYTGITLGTAANTVGGIHGATQIPGRVKDWQDVSAGKKTWQEATFNTIGTGLEVGAGLSEVVPAAYKIGKDIYDAGKGSNLFFNTSAEAQAARTLQDAGLLGKNVDPKIFGQYPYLAQNATKRILKDYNTTYRAVNPVAESMSMDDMINMAKSGYNIDDPTQIAEYMATTVPIGNTGAYRAGLDLHPTQDAIYTGNYKNATEAAQKLRGYGNYLSEVRPPMDFSEGNLNQWIDQHYTNKLFGTIPKPNDALLGVRNPEAFEFGGKFKSGAVGMSRNSEYWPYVGNKGEKLLESVRTIKLEQDGGENGDGAAQDNFLKNWFANRIMPTPEGQKLLEKVRPEAIERASQNVPYVMTDQLPKNVAGYYDTEDKNIYLNQTYTPEQINSTKEHERVHYVQDGDKFYKVLDTPHTNLVEQNIKQPKEINTGNPEWDKNVKENYDDIVPQEEMHARIMTLRRLAGFKPDQVITEEMLNNYFNSVKESGKALDPDIEDLKAVTKGNSSIINLLNDMVSAPQKKDTMSYAQEGGELDLYKKYVNGDFDGSEQELEAKKIYDKLNRVYYKPAKDAGMSVPNYIMSNVLTL